MKVKSFEKVMDIVLQKLCKGCIDDEVIGSNGVNEIYTPCFRLTIEDKASRAKMVGGFDYGIFFGAGLDHDYVAMLAIEITKYLGTKIWVGESFVLEDTKNRKATWGKEAEYLAACKRVGLCSSCAPKMKRKTDIEEVGMRVILGKKGLKRSFQHSPNGFPEETECAFSKCDGMARIAFVAFEWYDAEGKVVHQMHQNKPPNAFWVHDRICVAVYFCKKCLRPEILYDQG